MPGRRNVSLTCGKIIDFDAYSDCEMMGRNPNCFIWSIDPPSTIGSTIDPITGIYTVGIDCKNLYNSVIETIVVTDPCNLNISDSVDVVIGEVILKVEGTRAHPGAEGVQVTVSLKNPAHKIKGIQTDIWDENDHLSCTGCAPDPKRAPKFTCSAQELSGGECRVVLVTTNPSYLISEGEGPIFTIDYEVSEEAPSGDCIDAVTSASKVADRFGDELCVCEESGEICFFICGDVYPRECLSEVPRCGDGKVNIFDILEEIDIILGIDDYEASDCQKISGDVPTGTPPYCGCIGNEFCYTDGVIDIFDLLVIIDMALDKINCCDYCVDINTASSTTSIIPTTISSSSSTTSIPPTTSSTSSSTTTSPPPTTSITSSSTTSVLPTTSSTSSSTTTSMESTTSSTSSSTTTALSPPPPPPPPECRSDKECKGDGLFCNGNEICIGGKCKPKGNPCKDDNLFCNGKESCDEQKDVCVYGGDPCPDDRLFCNGKESCNEKDDVCLHSGNPCEEGKECDEENDLCVPMPIPCEIGINPETAMVVSEQSLSLTISENGDCSDFDYEWSVVSNIGSAINPNGNYIAGINADCSKETIDVIRVDDHANGISAEATVKVQCDRIVEVCPNIIFSSHWLPLPLILLIFSEQGNFDSTSSLTFEPVGNISFLWSMGIGDIMLALVLVEPNAQEGSLRVTVETGTHMVTKKEALILFMLPWILEK